MSLRGRLALVLAGILAGPLAAAAVVVGIVLPAAEKAEVRDRAKQIATATTSAVRDRCLSVGDAAQSVAAQVAATPGAVRPEAAQAAVGRISQRRPAFQVMVLDSSMDVIAERVDDEPYGDPAEELDVRWSCSAKQTDDAHAVLVESVFVGGEPTPSGAPATRPRATTFVWLRLDANLLREIRNQLGLRHDVDIALLPADGANVSLAATDQVKVDSVLGEAPLGEVGSVAGLTYSVHDADRGSPYRLLVVVPEGGLGRMEIAASVTLLLVALVAVGFLVKLLASRLTRPLDHLAAVAGRLGAGDYTARTGLSGRDEVGRLGEAFDAMATDLQASVAELRGNRDVLAETFARFGEALGRTHDLGGLLETVLEAAMRGGGCVVGTASLGDADRLEECANAVAEGARPSVTAAFGALSGLARKAVAARHVVMSDALAGMGPALAVPLQREDRVVGALAMARQEGGRPFEDAALQAVNALAASAGTAVGNVREHDETRRLSVTDPLTGAGNFRHLSTTLARETERAARFRRPLAVLMLDLDHFKGVNDSFGHAFGDAVLREFARRLQTCVREVDTVARYGGEEFAVVLPETDAEGAARVAARIVEVVHEEPFRVGARSRTVTVSVGVAAFPAHGRTGAEVMRSADAALYAAKDAGRNRWEMAGEGPDAAARASGGRRTRSGPT